MNSRSDRFFGHPASCAQPWGGTDIRAMEDMLDHLQAKKAFPEAQLQASEAEDPDLEWDLRRIEGRIDVLKEMLREARD